MIHVTDASLIVVFALIVGLLAGNKLGDDATLKDCATKESAVLMGGTTIECTVRKEPKK